MVRKPKAPLGASLVVTSSFFYASYGIWTKLMGNFFGGYTASALRSVLVLLFLLPFAVGYRQLQVIAWRRNWCYLLGMVVASLFMWGPLYFAILHVGVGVSLAVNYASLVVGMFFFGWLVARERFTRDKWLSAGLGVLGVALVFLPNNTQFGFLPLVAAVISGLGAAANSVIAKKVSYNATQSTLALWAASLVANAVMAMIIHESHPAIGIHIEWLYLLFFGVASVVASWSFVKGVKLIEAGAAGILGLLEIVFGVAFGLVLFHERPSPIALFGVVAIILAAAIPYVKDFNVERGTLEE